MDFTKVIDEYKNKDALRLHMPGHKGRSVNRQPDEFIKADITELSFSDNLNNPRGIIKQMKEELKKIYNTEESFILVNGSTSGILVAMNSILNENDTVLMGRNSHISAYHALLLCGAQPIFVYPNENGYISEDDYIEQIEKNNNIKCILLTYPDYFGRCLDIKKLCAKCRKKDIKIIVDEAHGAHLYFSDLFPISAVKCDVDIVVESLHKTLPCPTQTAILHIVSKNVDNERIKSYIKVFQSTSPSYPLISGAWEGIKFARDNAKDILENYKLWYNKLKDNFNDIPDFSLYGSYCIKNHLIFDYDPFKLWIKTKRNGYEISKLLEKKYNTFLEMDKEDGILAYMGIGSKKEDLTHLLSILKDIVNTPEYNAIPLSKETKHTIFSNIPKAMNIKEAFNRQRSKIDIKNNISGKVSGDFIIPYPPGYPLIIPGEIITEDVTKYIRRINDTQQILGVNDSKIFII